MAKRRENPRYTNYALNDAAKKLHKDPTIVESMCLNQTICANYDPIEQEWYIPKKSIDMYNKGIIYKDTLQDLQYKANPGSTVEYTPNSSIIPIDNTDSTNLTISGNTGELFRMIYENSKSVRVTSTTYEFNLQ